MPRGWLDLGDGWLFEHLRDAVIVVDAGQGCIQVWNAAAEQLFGIAASQASQQPIDRLLPELRRSEAWQALFDQAADDGRPIELQARRPDGAVGFPVEVALSLLEPPSGQRFVLLVLRDITERRNAEERLRTERALLASEERLQAALATQRFLDDASRELSSSLDFETTVQTIARLPLRKLADVCVVQALDDEGALSGSATAYLDGAGEATVEAGSASMAVVSVSEVALTGRPQVLAELADEVRGDGLAPEQRALLGRLGVRSAMLVPLLGGGRLIGLMLFGARRAGLYGSEALALAEDLARRCALALDNASLYRTAQRAIAARDQFLSIASHELRAPLARIKSHAEVLELAHSQGQLEPERLTWALGRINAAVDRLATLTKDVLDVSRLRGGQLPFHPRPVDLGDLVRDLEGRFADHLGDGHLLIVETDQQEYPVLVDQDRLEQIVANLLDNAAKYSPDGGEVRLSISRCEDGVVLRVRDQGIGLPRGAHARIFEPFGRGPNAELLGVPGMGLGLHICRVIVERHGGRIWAESDGEGQGTTMHVWLPFAAGSPMGTDDPQQRLTNQLTLAVGYCELLASSPDLPEQLRAQAIEAMKGAHGAVATLEDLHPFSR